MAVWDQQENETPKAYAAFCVYRDLSKSRSIDKAFQQHQNSTKTAPRHWMDWAVDFDWKHRAAAYDAHIELSHRKTREAEHTAELVAYRERARKAAQDTAAIASAALLKAGRRLQTLDPEQIDASALPGFLRAAAAVLESSLNAEAEAIGVRRLESLLDDADKSEGTGQ
jgi:hypothetical protein